MSNEVTLKINGNEVKATPGKTILQVCREQNLDDIPTLCYDEKLPPFGSCFLCVVEIEGQKKLFPSCSTKVADGMDIKTRSERVKKSRKTCLELLLSDHYADCFGPCRLNCPADVDIQGYMSLVHLGKPKEAIALIKEKLPFPSVCGRVCTRKCEVGCRRSITDDPVGIDFLKRYAADQDMLGEMWQPELSPDNGHRVAIIGGGPAGLTAAYYLVVNGYRPTIYEALPHLGGMLRYGIPEYRLPKAVLDKEINWITDLGVEVKTSTALGRDITIDSLFSDGFEAVFIGLGAQIGKPMRVENEEAEGVLSGVEFLQQVEMKTNPDVKGRVVVVGGGNTAIDAARTSLRLGADEVILLYRRTRKEMPANEMEIVAAEEEGIRMEFLAAPTKVNVDENGRMKSISANRMELGEPDESGRRRPVVIEGSEYTIEADWIVSAIGQEPDLTGVDGDGEIETTRWHTIEAAKGTFGTDRPGVFAGGDVVTGPADAVDAIAAGRVAARAIDKYIRTGIAEPLRPRFESKRDAFHKITPEDLPDIPEGARHHMPELSVQERIHSFTEVEIGFTDEMAKTEALRCAECGCDAGLACTLQDYATEYGVDQERFVGAFNRYKPDTRHPFIKIDSNKCIRCGRCVSVCSEILNVSALGFVNRGFKTIVKPALEKALHETNCVSCGNCVDVCPTGALVEKMPFRRSGPWRMEHFFNVCNYCSVGCNITLNVKTPDLFFVTGAPPETGPNQGELCVKGRFGYQHYLDGTRATRPMIRKNDKLVECSWEEAFKAIGEGMKEIRETHGDDSVLISASPKMTDEELYLAGRFARTVVGTNNITSYHRQINEANYHALDDMIGSTFATASSDDVANADMYIVLGGNPTIENPVLGWQIKRRMKNGTEAVVINSTEIDLTRYATAWADPRRGTSTLLLNGIMGELIRGGKIDESFISEKTTNFHQIKESLLSTDIDEIASVTGVLADKIRKIAEIAGQKDKKIVAVYNLESRIDRSTNDLKALGTLLMLLGKVGHDGSGLVLTTSQCNLNGMQSAGFDRHILPGGTTFDDPAGIKALSAVWQKDLTELFGTSGMNLQRKVREDKIRAAFVFGENPAAAEQFSEFFDKLDFLVVCDMFKTETAQMADVFLPMAGYLETDGHLTRWDGVGQSINPIGRPVNGMTNVDIVKKLSVALGQEIRYNKFEEIASELEFLKEKLRPSINGSFPTKDGKAHFVLYSTDVSQTPAKVPHVLEIDARMARQMQKIRA